MRKAHKNGRFFRLRNLFLIALISLWQVVFASAPFIQSGIVHAADIPSNKVGFSSVGFILGGSYSVVGGQPTGSGQLKNGNVGGYPEGACIPAQFNVTNNSNTTGDTVISPIFDYYNNGVVGITNYEKITAPLITGDPSASVDNLNDFSYSGQPLGPATTTFPTSNGTPVNAAISAVFSGDTAGTSNTTATDAFRHYNIALTGIPSGTTVYILLCARLSLDASQYPGSSLSLRTVQGGAENVPIPVNQILSLPSITVNKTVSGGSATASDFSFNLSSDPHNGLGTHYTIASGQSSVTIPNVNPDGNYTITESGPSNYVFSSGSGTSCSVVQGSLNTAAGQMTASVAAGTTGQNPTIVNATCNFTNSYQTGHITVTKVVNINNGGTAVVSDFPLFVNQTSVTSGVSNSFPANQSYTISETQKTGYHQDSIVCKNTADNSTLSNPFTLSPNENVSCTITNSDIAPKLTLVKQVSGGTAVATDWTLSATPSDNQYSTLSGSGGFSKQTARANLDYTLSESGGPTGYSASSWDCTGGTLTNGNSLKLALADDVTCTITNTRNTGSLTVNKMLVPSNDSGKFNLSMTGPTSYTANDQGNNGTTGTKTVDTGSYTVSEAAGTNTDLKNYSSSYSCVDGQTSIASGNVTTSTSFNVAKDQTIVCTFTNTRYASISGFKYEVNADSSKVGALQSWTIYLYDGQGHLIGTTTTDNLGNFVFNDLMAGSYTLGENLNSGWTQIYSPNGVTLSAGQNSTDNNFGNFQNAQISGAKFNDVNGNHQWDNNEGGLSGWTINLSKSNGNGGWTSVGSTVTGNGGAYSFTDLAPNDYKLCETGQTGWTQTYPTANSGCNLVTVALSGHNYTDNNFGNQGQGTITVVKNVDDGFGNVTPDVTNWTWGYSGTLGIGSGLSTGSANSQTVAAGTYSVTENQKTDYHVTASSCSGENDSTVNTSKSVTVSPGENVTCTFTNTRDTGTITVNKTLRPDTDTGKFNLRVDSVTKASNVGDGGTTNQVKVVTGTHSVDETAGTSTSLNDYTSSFSCVDGNSGLVSGSGTASGNFTVNKDSNVVCTFTNTHLGQVTGSKFNDINGNHVWDSGEPGLQGWTIHLYDCTLPIVSLNLSFAPVLDCSNQIGTTTTGVNGSYSFTNLDDGTYKVCEVQQDGWTQTYPQTSDGCTQFTINLTDNPAQSVTANFGNQGMGSITVIKNVDDGFGHVTNDVTNWTWGYSGTLKSGSDISTGSGNDRSVPAGTYTVSEDQKDNYHVTASSCTGEESTSINTSKYVTVSPGEDVVCTFTNTRDTGTITVNKELFPSNDSGLFNLKIGDTTYATDVGDGGTTDKIKVVTGEYSVSETAGTGTNLKDYQSQFWCSNEEWGNGTESGSFNVGSDEDVTCTFQNVRLGTLTGMKYEDLNNNGQKDSGEQGLQDWTINLYSCQQEVFSLNIDSIWNNDNQSCNPTLEGTTQTDANGNYQFNDLTTGDYKVCEALKDGWTQTDPGTSDGCALFTINLNTDGGDPGQITTINFGNFKHGSISGFKFSDPNGNGKFDNGEVKLSGWTINLNKSDGKGGWTQVDTSVTDASGNYSFSDLEAGDYQVCEVPQDGWIRIFPTGSDCQTGTINQSGQNIQALFGNQKKTTPQVLALTVTGQPILISIVAGSVVILSLITVTYVFKKQN